MGNAGTTQKTPRTGQNRFFVFLLVFAAISSVGKDLDRLYTMTRGIYGLTTSWLQSGSTVTLSEPATVDNSCPEALALEEKNDQLRLSGPIAARQANEIGGLHGGIAAEPARGGEVEVSVTRKARSSVRVTEDMWVRPPATEIAAKIDRVDVTGAPDSRMVDGHRDLDLPASLDNAIKVETFRGNISSDFAFKVAGRVSRKHFRGFGECERELILKTLKGVVHVKELARGPTSHGLTYQTECAAGTDQLNKVIRQ